MPQQYSNQRQNRDKPTFQDYSNNIPIDLHDFDANDIIGVAENSCKDVFCHKKYGIKTNQIRNFFSHINTIQMKYKKKKQYHEDIDKDLILLKPKLAYAAGRQKQGSSEQDIYKLFTKLLSKAIDGVRDSKEKDKAIENYFAFVEAIVAYHKYHGGKDN